MPKSIVRRPSSLWEELSASLFSNIDRAFLERFRAPGGANRRLAAWDPCDPTMRYFKFLLYGLAERQPPEFFEAYRRLRNTETGAPVTVSLRDCRVDVDYFLAVEEYLFLRRHAPLESVRTVVEIGAGFGRTCHALLSLVEGIESYAIVDLPAVLKLSRNYLREVAPKLLSRVRFIENRDAAAWRALRPDLTINIDSFQEMPPAAIDQYMSGLVAKGSWFYNKNPIAKYRPECVVIRTPTAAEMRDVYSLGRCRDVIDIFDERALAAAAKRYVDAYRPARGWKLAADEPTALFPYLRHALYGRS